MPSSSCLVLHGVNPSIKKKTALHEKCFLPKSSCFNSFFRLRGSSFGHCICVGVSCQYIVELPVFNKTFFIFL